jgi:large subunit ribosomal protein L21
MYVIVESGGMQYAVREGETLKVPKITLPPGETHNLDKVLLIMGGEKPVVGRPYVEGARVETEVLGNGRAEKVLAYHFKKRTKYRKMRGHRQEFTELKIARIITP